MPRVDCFIITWPGYSWELSVIPVYFLVGIIDNLVVFNYSNDTWLDTLILPNNYVC